ncbi:unnamed protein product [Schistosoma mattheei]|uniref:Uncharacterized protein n=1 Tax=Schistosoma mattheei TaxID=31246 RepID=A0A183PSB6_9TREM|nr:unnamed protein product [Schistosoma mattheei]
MQRSQGGPQAFRDLPNGERTNMEKNWKEIKGAITSTLNKTELDSRKEEQEGSNQYQLTRAEKAKAQAEYTEVNKQVKRSIRTEKRKYVEHLTMMIEKAAREGNMRQLYDTTNNLAGNYRKPERLVKSKEGKVITNIEEQRNKWVEHFKELLDRPAPLNPPNIEAAPTGLQIDVGPPTSEEISMAIRQIKSGKARGSDNTPAEAFKADEVITAKILHILFNKTWDEEQVPTDWKEGHLIKIPKKGYLNKCEDYRGITLLSISGKVFNRVLLNRMKDSVDAQLRDQQAGLSNDRSCADQITTLRIIVEQSIECNLSLYINFVDYEKAFGSVDRTTLWGLLRQYGMAEKMINIIRSYYGGINCEIAHGGRPADTFEVKTGVREAHLLPPSHFLMVTDCIMKTSSGRGTGYSGQIGSN